MGFSNLIGLSALICVPIIIILYMLRPKNTPFTLPSLYLWKVMENEIESATRFQKFKSSLLMFLQIAAVVLVALILAGLYREGGSMPNQVIIVVDCSVSMQSKDVLPSRMEVAKEQAIAYVKKLDKDAQVTLVALKDIPEILLTNESDQKRVQATIEDLNAVDTYADMELAVQTGYALRQDEETTIVYFGDRVYPGAQIMEIGKSSDNVGIHGLSYTIYEKTGSISVLADIANEGSEKVAVPVSLYADDILLDAKEVELEALESGKIFFDDIPIGTKTVMVQIDRKDNLEVDDKAYAIIASNPVRTAVLVSESNVFLEKVLKLNKGLEVYLAKPDTMSVLKGYDLYIYDTVLPEVLPEDGAILLFGPPENELFEVLGHAKNPTIYSAGHEITDHIEYPEFSIGLTQIYEVPTWAKSVLDTEYGSCAFAGTYNGVRMTVFGFDLHHTDLPLLVEFPIMMMNTMGYLVPGSMLNGTSISAGSPMEIRIMPSTEEAYILTPDGVKEQLDITSEETLYKNTFKTGVYTLFGRSKGVETQEQFAVNVPRKSQVEANINGEGNRLREDGGKSLNIILGLSATLIIVLEWFIYQWRRKINAVKY